MNKFSRLRNFDRKLVNELLSREEMDLENRIFVKNFDNDSDNKKTKKEQKEISFER